MESKDNIMRPRNVARWFEKTSERYANSYVLRRREHHGDLYYDVTSDEQLEAVALSILYDTWVDRWQYMEFEEPEKPALSEEAIVAMPECEAKKVALKEISDYKSELATEIEENAWNELCKETLLGRDGKLALWILYNRIGFSYDTLQFEPFCDTKLPKGDLLKAAVKNKY